MAYRSFGGSGRLLTRLDTPPLSGRRHPDSFIAQGNYDQAIADETKAIELKPDYGKAYYGRGVVSAAKGDPVRALIDFRAAVPLIPASDKRHDQALARVAD